MRKWLCILLFCSMCLGVWGCEKTEVSKTTFFPEESVQETATDEKSTGILPLLDMTYTELQAAGELGELVYYIGGGAPVFSLTHVEDVFLEFPGVSDVSSLDSIGSELCDRTPTRLLIENAAVTVDILPIAVGMTADTDRELLPTPEEIYTSSENALYYTVYSTAGYKVTAAWAIPEEMYTEWASDLPEDVEYYAAFDAWVQTFQTEPVGTIQQILIEKESHP